MPNPPVSTAPPPRQAITDVVSNALTEWRFPVDAVPNVVAADGYGWAEGGHALASSVLPLTQVLRRRPSRTCNLSSMC